MRDKKKNTQEHDVVENVDIGALLLGQREKSGVSLKAAAKALNLSANTIENIEFNSFLQVGGSVYVRGYLALYAKYLKLDPDYVVSVYDRQNPAEPIAIKPALANKYRGKKQSKRHSKTLSFLVVLIFFGGLLYGYKQFEPVLFGSPVEEETTTVPTSTVVDSPVDIIVEKVDGVQVIADDALNGLPVANSGNELVSDLALNSLSFEGGSNSVAKLKNSDDIIAPQDVLNLPGMEGASLELGSGDSEVNENGTIDKQSKENSSLVIAFKDRCWLEIKDASGKLLASGIYSARKPVTIEGRLPFTMKTARKEAVKEVILNGSEVELDAFKVKKRRYVIK